MVPITFHHTWTSYTEKARLTVMNEFAVNGAKHLLVPDTMFCMMAGDYKLLKVLQEQITKAGLTFVDSHAPFRDFGDLFIPDQRDWQEMIARQKLNLLLANELGVKTCTFHAGSKYYNGYSLVQHREAVYRSLDELLPFAEELDIVICLENLVRPLSTAEDLISYMEKYSSNYLGVCFDSGHANLKEKGEVFPDSEVWEIWKSLGLPVKWEENIIERLQPYIVNCHIHDNNGITDEHKKPGTGTINWERIVPALLNAPRLQNIQCEISKGRWNMPIRTSIEVMYDLFGVKI